MVLLNPFNKIYQSEDFKSVLTHKLVSFPYIVDIELTNYCNFNCLFCGQQTMKRHKGFISRETFKKIVDECAEHNTPVRLIRWGEPLLHPEIIDFCQYIKDKGLPLHITTNGSLLTEDKMKAFIDMELDSIIFSFQGVNKEGYEQMRGEHYDQLVENIHKFMEMKGDKKPYVHITSTMTTESPMEIRRFKDKWEVDEVTVGKTNLERLNPSQIRKLDNIGKIEELIKGQSIEKKHRPCTEVFQKLSVDWDGKVSACCADWDNFMTVGDINKTTLEDIWHNSEDEKIYRKLLKKMKHNSLTMCSCCYHTYQDF